MTNRQRGILITYRLFASVLINILLFRHPQALPEKEINICTPTAVCPHPTGTGITELAQGWAPALQMDLAQPVFLVRLIKLLMFLSFVVLLLSHHPLGQFVIC